MHKNKFCPAHARVLICIFLGTCADSENQKKALLAQLCTENTVSVEYILSKRRFWVGTWANSRGGISKTFFASRRHVGMFSIVRSFASERRDSPVDRILPVDRTLLTKIEIFLLVSQHNFRLRAIRS